MMIDSSLVTMERGSSADFCFFVSKNYGTEMNVIDFEEPPKLDDGNLSNLSENRKKNTTATTTIYPGKTASYRNERSKSQQFYSAPFLVDKNAPCEYLSREDVVYGMEHVRFARKEGSTGKESFVPKGYCKIHLDFMKIPQTVAFKGKQTKRWKHREKVGSTQKGNNKGKARKRIKDSATSVVDRIDKKDTNVKTFVSFPSDLQSLSPLFAPTV
jgi:hypothetical protein